MSRELVVRGRREMAVQRRSVRRTLFDFVTEQLCVESEVKIDRFEVRHIVAGQRNDRVAQVRVVKKKTAEQFAEDLERAAQRDAEGIGGSQSYSVEAFFGRETEHGARTTITIYGPQPGDEGELMTEPPTDRGAMGQAMRHSEYFAREMARTFSEMLNNMGVIMDRSNDAIARRDAHIEKLEAKYFEMFAAVEQLRDGTAARDIQKIQAMSAEGRKDKAFKGLMKLASRFVPEKAERKALRDFFSSLSDQQLGSFIGGLDDKQRAAAETFIAMIDVKDDDEDEKDEKKPPAKDEERKTDA